MNTIAIDAMGGDSAPAPEVEGALSAVRKNGLRAILVGDEERVQAELRRLGASPGDRIQVVHASEVVTMHDHPGQVFRQKRESSMRKAFDLVKAGEADAVVSAGNSGALLSHALFVLGRLPGVERPGIVTVFPTPDGTLTLCDMGANVEVRPTMLAQFGILGAHYDRVLHGHQRPRVGLLSNGTEDSKGTELTRAAHELLVRAAADTHAQFEYVGYVEGSGLFNGDIDVVATDGFTGNVVLKLSEGVSQAVIRMVKRQLESSIRAKLGAALAKPALQKLRQVIHYSEAGGAVLLGVKKLVMICHGRSSGLAMENAIRACDGFVTANLPEELAAAIERHQRVWQKVENGSAAAASGDA